MGDRLLTHADRCDGCGARAYARAVFPHDPFDPDYVLLFCRHHWVEYGDRVRLVAIDVVDETEYVLEAD